MKKIILLITCFFLLFGCSSGEVADNDTLKIYTSFYGMYDFTKMIAKDSCEITMLIPTGVEAHHWEPGTSDIIGLNEADVFIYSGMNMEPWAEKLIESIDNKNLLVIKASDGIIENTDPHVWLDPQNAIIELENITEGLCNIDPENAEQYRMNFESAKIEMINLDNEYENEIKKFTDKELIVTNNAFGYMCDAYGLTQRSIEGLVGESDPSSATLREIIDYMKGNNKKSLFYIEAAGDKIAKIISEETGADIYPLNPFEGDGSEKNYFEIMSENLDTLKKALGNI